MQKRHPVLFVILLFMVFPVFQTAASAAQKGGGCPVVSEKPVAIFIQPTDKKIERMKQEDGEDFYTIADDAMYYQAQAAEYLDRMRFPYCFSEHEVHSFKTDSATVYTVDRKCDGWCLLLWNSKEEPVWTSSIDITMHEAYLKRAGSM